ncbi:MAG TPA: chromosome segregation protein SMC [Vicinamibacterales bacterium]|nr:chromosome segregation protein SMC [Vicinamibacterales bacterium]
MRLSKLHINGFKSFPDRAELGFDVGVTAIVGPNGCGKSNVVDAITWVLGEQSAKSLRGERMEDVIFSGSDARKPTATAEVRLKLTDVARAALPVEIPADPATVLLDELPLVTRDVEIGRRLYRSGESEYLIDGEVCRLRDIHDLLMDSGLGVKAYAVIEQGKIGQILSSRPTERRALIEEAAGVTKYKARRRAAELKLEAAQQNLTRVDDIIFEVEKQRAALKRQAARARRYKRLREELRRWEQVHLAHRHASLARQVDEADMQLTDRRAREAGAAAHVAELEVALETVRLNLTQAESGATTAREEAHARELDFGRRQQQVQFDKQQIATLAEQAASFAAEVTDLETRREPARAAIETQRGAAARAQEALDNAAAELALRESAYSESQSAVQRIEQDSDTTRASVLAAASTLAALMQARDNAAAVMNRVAAERERFDLESRELDAERARLRDGLAAAERELASARSALESLARDRQHAETKLADLRSNRERVGQALNERGSEAASLAARLQSLEELDASRASFGDAAKLLLGEGSAHIRAHGAVADHLNVERPYERAVDALLGDLLQHVVVERTAEVQAALALLSDRDAGRCGFVVLEEAAAAPAPAPLVVPGGTRSLADVVRATGPHRQAIERLIGSALIADSLEAAALLARSTNVPVATTSGEVLRRAGLVEGGSRRDARGILETRAEIQSLRDKAEAARQEVEALKSEDGALALAIPAAETALNELVESHHDRGKTIVSLESDVRRIADEQARASRRLEMVRSDLGRAEEEVRGAESRRDESIAAIALQETQQRDAEGRLSGVAASLQTAREEAEARLRLASDARTAQATHSERLNALRTEIARLEESASDLQTRIGQRRDDIERTRVRRDELEQSIRDTEQLLNEDVTAIETMRANMRGLDEQVVNLRAEFSAADQRIRSARHVLEGVRADVLKAEVARTSAMSDLTHLAELCLETIGIAIDQVVEEVARMEDAGELASPSRRLAAASMPDDGDEGEDETDAALEAGAAPAQSEVEPRLTTPEDVITDLKKKIDRLGPVNMMAIEQFDELESRHTFLTTQRKDLLDSIALTGEAIRKIDKTTQERFEEAFRVINEHFEKTFTTLFGGGRAGLHLIDLENDQESGIDIIAQPPGKRLQNVQLLSGGEKALTAMALMFAIFKYRPSPFCLLDEIDAPLDDANIGRFVEMLQGLQTNTQFILITHNRKTMEIADRLYGVTMEEPGVSKLISVQLN